MSLFLGRNNLSLGAEGWEKHKLLPADPSSLTEGILAGTPDGVRLVKPQVVVRVP